MTNDELPPGKISVIIPTFNYGHFIADCIKSVIRQGHNDCEIIVVDDGSTDDTESILKPFSNQIRYIYQDNQGLSAARNTGLKHATGEFIQFLDSDDLLGKDAFQGRLTFLKANPDCSIAVCRNSLFTRTNRHGLPVKKGRWELYQSNLALHLCRFNIAPPHAFLLRRCVVDDVSDFDTSLSACEDYDYWLRAVIQGFIPQYCPDGEVFYRVHGSSMSANRTNQVRHDAEMHLRLYNRLFVDKTYPMVHQVALPLAYLTGTATTLSRLRASNQGSTIFKELERRFQEVLKVVNAALNTSAETGELTIRLYTQWFAYLTRKEPELRQVVAAYNDIDNYLKESLRMARLPQNLLISFFKGQGERLEAKRLSQLSMAAKFPRIAATILND